MSPINIKIIFGINLLGLLFSFLARKLINKQAIRMIIPTIFLYLSTIATMYMIINSRKPESVVESVPMVEPIQMPKIADKPKSKIFNRELYQSKKIDMRVNFTDSGLSIDNLHLLDFSGVNSLGENSSIDIQLVDQNNQIVQWSDYSNRVLMNDELDLQVEMINEKYLTKFKLGITNHGTQNNNLRVRYTLNPAPDARLQAYMGNKAINLSNPQSLSKPKWFGYTLNNYWANYTISEFDSVNVISNQTNSKYIVAERSISVEPGKSADVIIQTLNSPTKITVLREYKKEIKTDPDLLLDSGGGLFGSLKRIILAPCLLLFEVSSKILGHPVFGMIILILTIKLLMAYNSYRAHSFGTEIQKIMKIASTGGSPDAVKHALSNSNLNMPSKIISVSVKLFFFMIFYKIFQTSPLFYGSKFLWVKDLSAPDKLQINNLFGIFPLGNYLPTIGLLPLCLGLSFFLETWFKHKNSPKTPNPNDQILSMSIVAVVLTLIFSRMQAVLCIYMIINTSIDNIQNYLFDKIMTRSRKRR